MSLLRYLVTLRPETLPPLAPERFVRLNDVVCAWPPGDPARDDTPYFKAMYPERAAHLLTPPADLTNALRLLPAGSETVGRMSTNGPREEALRFHMPHST